MFNGLLYPTVAMAARSDNLAIKTDFVDQHLQFGRAELFDILVVRQDGFEYALRDFANTVSEDGLLEWKGRLPHYTVTKDRPLMATAEGGRSVVRDRDGNVLEPG